MNSWKQYRKLTITVSLIVIAGIFVIFSIILFQRNGKVAITVRSLPVDSSVIFNGTPTKEGVTYVEPGTYTVIVKKEGFANYQQTVAVAEGNPATVSAALVPVSDEAKKWAKDHKSEYADFTTLKQDTEVSKETKIKNLNPITQKLPYKNLLYNISYRADETDRNGERIVIQIDASRAYREAALFQIRKWSFDPTDYIIEFRGYTNPITS